VLCVAVLAASYGVWRFAGRDESAKAAPPPPAVPVGTAPVRKRNVAVYLDGLGTVQALNVVEIKAQVNGTLIALPAAEGQEVHKGDIVAEIDPRPYRAALDQALAQRQGDQAQLQSAQLDLRRYQDLARRSFAPVQQVDDQQASVDKLTAAIAADNAMIETARINLGYCVIRAPIDGRVSLYQLDVGNLVEVASQSGIVSITQDRPISMVFTLPEGDLARVRQAQANGPVVVDPAVLAQGTLLTPNNAIDTATGTISMKATFANQDDRLWPGQFVNARVKVKTLPDAVTVPLTAVQHGPDGLFVFVDKPDGSVAQSAIKVGYEDDGMAVVTQGLAGNETVVVSGQSRLAPGTKVKATAAAAAATAPSDQTADAAGDAN
jgi:multidrug efflux system membrane fusion protein